MSILLSLGKWIKKHMVVSIIIGIIVIGGAITIPKIVNNNSVKGSITSIEDMRFILPEEFKHNGSDSSFGDGKYYTDFYDYKSSLEYCSLRVVSKTYASWEYSQIEASAKDHLQSYGSNITTKTIKKRNWETTTVVRTNENTGVEINESYVYAIKTNDTSLYVVEFTFSTINNRNYDSSSYCSKAHNTIVNSLDFK